MARTRITTTNDATVPRCVALPGGVIWYAYLRTGGILCVQREVGGALDPEVAVTSPVTWFDAELDPSGTKGWIFFIHDGVLEKLEVTNLVADPFTAVALTRSTGWYEGANQAGAGFPTMPVWSLVDRVPLKRNVLESVGALGAGFPTVAWAPENGPYPPTLAIEAPYGFPTRTLVVTLPDRSLYLNRNIIQVHFFRQEDPGVGFLPYSVVPVGPLDTVLYAYVAVTGTPETKWFARCVRLGYQAATSRPSNTVTDNGNLPPIYLENVSGRGAGFPTVSFATVNREPVKKLVLETLNTPTGAGFPFTKWALDGQDVLNP